MCAIKYFLILTSFALSILQAKDYRGAELRTIATYTYGRFEVRMKSAPHPGVVSSLFTFHEYGSAGIEHWNEIDIEFLGRYTDRVQFNTITDWQVGHEHFETLSFDPAESFHDYAFEWTPDYVAWFVDGVEVERQTGAHISQLNRAQKMMMNIWPPDYPSWVGTFDPNNLPIYAFYDWARYYAYVPGTGNTGTNNNFIQLWHDDFDAWDTARWQKASHTWDGNNCDFIPINAAFQGGYFILCLTTPQETGYRGPTLGTVDDPQAIPETFGLSPAWPNPFNAWTHFTITGERDAQLTVDIFDITGQLQWSTSRTHQAGHPTQLSWDGRDAHGNDLASGTYFIKASSPDMSLSTKMLLLR